MAINKQVKTELNIGLYIGSVVFFFELDSSDCSGLGCLSLVLMRFKNPRGFDQSGILLFSFDKLRFVSCLFLSVILLSKHSTQRGVLVG